MNLWRTRVNHWVAPLARRCPVSPNAISCTALLLNLAAALCFAAARREPRLLIGGAVLAVTGGLLDAFDGAVAREQGLSSRLGDFLDHVFDRISDTALLAGWTIGAGVRHELALVTLATVTLNGYIGTQVEATFSERSYDEVGRGEFVVAIVAFPLVQYLLVRAGLAPFLFQTLSIADWLTAAVAAFALFGAAQRFRNGIRLAKMSGNGRS